jgi:hypothetical protein
MTSRQTGDNYIRQLIHYSTLVPERFKKNPTFQILGIRRPYAGITLKVWQSKNIEARCIYMNLSLEETDKLRQMLGVVLTHEDYYPAHKV